MNFSAYAKSFHLTAFALLLSLLAVVLGPVSAVRALTGAIILSHDNGPVGTLVLVDGVGFTPGAIYSIRFAATVVATGNVASDNTIARDFAVPAVSRGTYQVTVTTASDTSNAASFTVTPVITLDSTSGRAGSKVKVSGSGFRASSAVTIYVDATQAGSATTNTSGSFSNILITIPPVAEGAHEITARDSIGASPAVSYSTATAGISLGKSSGYIGDRLVVSGSGFLPGTSVTILFDNSAIGSASTDSSGAFSNQAVVVPGSAAGEHHVAGKDAIGTSPEVSFTTLAPEISLSQVSGKVGDQITASGVGFVPDASVALRLDSGTSFASVTADAAGKFSDELITVPPGTRGKHAITGRDAFNTSPGASFEIIQSLVANPVTGTVGSTVTVNGYGFKASTVTLDFDGAPQPVNAVADAAGTFTAGFHVPEATSGAHTIRVRDSGGNEAIVNFAVVAGLTISPDAGPSGAVVKITGGGFKADALIVIKFNGTPVVTSPQALKTGSRGSFNAAFEVPPSLAGSYIVEASDGMNSAAGEFTSVLAATISQITSEAAPGHIGMQLTIEGAGFNPSATVTVTRATIQEPIATAKTSASGVFSVDFTLPPSPAGKHTIIVTDGTNTREFQFFIEQEPPPVPLMMKPEASKKVAELRQSIGKAEQEIKNINTMYSSEVNVESLKKELLALRQKNLEEASFQEKADLIARLGIKVIPSEDLKTRRISCRVNPGDNLKKGAENGLTKVTFGGAEVSIGRTFSTTFAIIS